MVFMVQLIFKMAPNKLKAALLTLEVMIINTIYSKFLVYAATSSLCSSQHIFISIEFVRDFQSCGT